MVAAGTRVAILVGDQDEAAVAVGTVISGVAVGVAEALASINRFEVPVATA